MKILLVGGSGLLGSEFRALLSADAYYAPSSSEMDIRDATAIQRYCADKPDISAVINCAASRDAEYLEDHETIAREINVIAARELALFSKRANIPFIHFSSDYVFDGLKNTPYLEGDVTNPLSVYGRTKLDGEIAVLENSTTCLCIRTAWVFSVYGKDFVKTIIANGAKRDELKVVFDQVGSPTHGQDIARAVLDILPKIRNGTRAVYHLTNEGVCSWYDLAWTIVRHAGLSCKVTPIHTSEYLLRSPRPSYSVLDKGKIKRDFGLNLRHWSEALSDCITLVRARTSLLD
jgi:dTDP-4-dehydrorhamnose reductase